MLVPAEILEPPEYRHLHRADCAQVLDGYLRRLARQDTACRRILGRLADAFLFRDGHHKLGFAKLGDYARERLGISGRELQELAPSIMRNHHPRDEMARPRVEPVETE